MLYEHVWIVGVKWKVISCLFYAKAQHFLPIHTVHKGEKFVWSTAIGSSYVFIVLLFHSIKCHQKEENISRVSRVSIESDLNLDSANNESSSVVNVLEGNYE